MTGHEIGELVEGAVSAVRALGRLQLPRALCVESAESAVCVRGGGFPGSTENDSWAWEQAGAWTWRVAWQVCGSTSMY